MCAHAYHVRTRIYVLSYLISVPFFFFVDCGLGLGLVVGLGSVLVLFFLSGFFFSMYVKRLKITTRSTVPCWLSGAVFVLCLLSQRVTGSNPLRAIISLHFSFNFFLQVFCN